jgi:hypothetical protein
MPLLVITLIGAFLRFYNLMWGDGNFFHPDENNMARSISQMNIAQKLYPDFFAYGQFPLYASYFLVQVLYFVTTTLFKIDLAGMFPFHPVAFKDAVFGLRFFSALFSTCTIPVAYFLLSELIPKNGRFSYYPLIGASLVAFLPGLIQSAHFGTTESILTFFFLLTIYLSVKLLRTKHHSILTILLGIALGLSMGTKITAVLFFIPPILAIFLIRPIISHKISVLIILKKVALIGLLAVSAFIFFFISSPYSVLDWTHFRDTSRYESEVATGAAQVFYTRQFIDTTPFIFQMTHVFPYVLGVGLVIAGFISFFILPFLVRKFGDKLLIQQYIVITISFLVFLVLNTMLFIKWTRFLTPLIPIIVVNTVLFLFLIEKVLKKTVVQTITAIILVITILSGVYFFILYTREDIRLTASRWIYDNIPNGSYILSETGNVVDIPLEIKDSKNTAISNGGTHNYTVISFDFYHLEQDNLEASLVDHLGKAEYIFVPSRRIFANHIRFPDKYPLLNTYYTKLFNGELGFSKVAEFNAFPLFSDERAEETWTVFDHPVIRVFKKVDRHDKLYYQEVLEMKEKNI